jgi:hypothetical protein
VLPFDFEFRVLNRMLFPFDFMLRVFDFKLRLFDCVLRVSDFVLCLDCVLSSGVDLEVATGPEIARDVEEGALIEFNCVIKAELGMLSDPGIGGASFETGVCL